MDYKDALIEGLLNKELVKAYDRLYGAHLSTVIESIIKGGINLQIDLATGFTNEEINKFDAFFYEFVWSRLPDECFA